MLAKASSVDYNMKI